MSEKLFFSFIALVLNLSFITAEELSLSDLNANYKLKLENIKLKFLNEPIDNLKQKYQERVKELKSEYSKKGELDAALAAEQSINLIPVENSFQKYNDFRDLSKIHQIYVESEKKIQKRYNSELIQAIKRKRTMK